MPTTTLPELVSLVQRADKSDCQMFKRQLRKGAIPREQIGPLLDALRIRAPSLGPDCVRLVAGLEQFRPK